ncbi:MAG: rubrerythrin family protein [Nitrososphaerota archaeon]|nr:rubrerythrin family protein [Candidatus Calditenuaceae archaeon]MDW8072953.1 rubrerythrin family protein [Nitrososphaerota archaeon]
MSKQLKKYAIDEYHDYIIYKSLASLEKDSERREILSNLSRKEYEHFEFWKQLSKYQPNSPSRLKIWIIILLRRLLGLVFMARLLERHERSVVKWYRELYSVLPPKERETLFHIIKEEEELEKMLIGQIQEGAVKYLGFIVLGLADSIIEISGVHAGFLGATNMTLFAGIAGLVVGFAAAISMGVAAYLQAKQMPIINPMKAALLTGLTYISSVSLQALPFFMTADILIAFASSIAISITLMTGFTYYGVVIRDLDARRELALNITLTLGTAAATYLFGDFLSNWLGLRSLNNAITPKA